MTIDKEFITTIIAIVGSAVVIARRMATKDDIKDLETKLETKLTALDDKLSAKLDKLTEIKADKTDVNQRLISIENYLRLPIAPKQETPR